MDLCLKGSDIVKDKYEGTTDEGEVGIIFSRHMSGYRLKMISETREYIIARIW